MNFYALCVLPRMLLHLPCEWSDSCAETLLVYWRWGETSWAPGTSPINTRTLHCGGLSQHRHYYQKILSNLVHAWRNNHTTASQARSGLGRSMVMLMPCPKGKGIKAGRMTVTTATGRSTKNWLLKAMKVLRQLTTHMCWGFWFIHQITRLLRVDSISVGMS